MYIFVIVCALLALSTAPAQLQVVAFLALLAYVYVRRQAPLVHEQGGPRVQTDPIAREEPTRAAERFQDAKAAIDLVTAACATTDPSKASELAGALDDCMEEYMRVLTVPLDDGNRRADLALVSHMGLRAKVLDILAEAYVVASADVPALDQAAAKLGGLFQACDAVMYKDGKAARPGPLPVPC